jgi:quercetin dioxygenase-like cupin family protein
MQNLSHAGHYIAPKGQEPNHFVEHLRREALSVGTYCIPVGGIDDQQPHREDEIYVVTAGRARLETPDGAESVAPGDVLFVPAGEQHRFVDVTEALAVLVCFAPAHTGATP